MAEQVRAIRTRQTILMSAAKVFESRGYQAATISEILTAAGVTKGALYFHFQSKDELAQGVLSEQDQRIVVPERASKIQEMADTVLLHAHRLQVDPLVRAGVRLSMDQQPGLDRSGPFLRWGEISTEMITKAQAQGELLPHVVPAETADVIVGAFAGIQSMSQAVSDYADLPGRVSALLRHLLPSVTMPAVLASLDLSDTRGADVYAEAVKILEAQDAEPDAGIKTPTA
ncbi:ScbR family autoregulator-binding transcription factor [Streptomyces sp. NPDC091268]|uniref:ScbR family autoregulator-binding transcription factor n=1 Tax=Streptomyces sp. NPDC091268 TaxID=3365979 RepID=UPI00380E6E30